MTQIFTDAETTQLQQVTNVDDTTDSVTLIVALLTKIANDKNNAEAIELYKSIMYVPRFPKLKERKN